DLQREIAATMVSAGGNQREGVPCSLEFSRRDHGQQGPQVSDVLWTLHIITGQDLQGDQVAGPGNAHPQLRQKDDRLGIRRLWMKASASASVAKETTRSASRVNRGSVRTETARPQTSANGTPASVSSVLILRRAASREVNCVWRPRQPAAQQSRRSPRPDAPRATGGVGGRWRPRSRLDIGAAGSA